MTVLTQQTALPLPTTTTPSLDSIVLSTIKFQLFLNCSQSQQKVNQ